ncbi:MAG: signal peptide peptidase SppA [Methylococcales bacterium]|nr:signal peptide peptidase SppA [Methylococcales bacterium]
MNEDDILNQAMKTEKETSGSWERDILEKVALAAVVEQRRSRRWANFFKSLMFLYLIGILMVMVYPLMDKELSGGGKPHTAVIDILGVIAETEDANAEDIIKGLRAAAKNKQTKGIILNINSPGGSPVQSAYIYDEIRLIKAKYPKLPIYSVVGDICASGGYYIAAASDKIFVNPASIIGSIGVIMNGFGFVDVLEKLGVERRLLTAGSHKAMLDPFSPSNEVETAHMQALLDEVHQQFIDAVRQGRGDRLKETEEMFSGLVWTGAKGVKLGLADGFGSVDSIAQKEIGAKKRLNFTVRKQFLDELIGELGASFAHELNTKLFNFSLR